MGLLLVHHRDRDVLVDGENKMKMAVQLFRVRNNKTNNWWEGLALDDVQACYFAGWERQDCYIRVKSTNGCGGWKKYKKEGGK
jgi:hypothetical protein